MQGDFPHLEGKAVKYLNFGSEADVAERRAELEAIARAWIAFKERGDSKPRSRKIDSA